MKNDSTKLLITNDRPDRYSIKYFSINQHLFKPLLFVTIIILILAILVFFMKARSKAWMLLILYAAFFIRFWYYSILSCQITITPSDLIYRKNYIVSGKINRSKIQLAEIREKEIRKTKFSPKHILFVLQVISDGRKIDVLTTTEKNDCYTLMSLINEVIRIPN